MSERVAYVNGQFVPEDQACVSVYDSAIIYGAMVFEVTRTFRHKLYRLEDHTSRLSRSLKFTRIDPGLAMDEMSQAALETVERNEHLLGPDGDYFVTHNISQGRFPDFREPGVSYPPATVIVTCWPLSPLLAPFAKFYDTGVHTVTVPNRAVPAQCLEPKVKNRSRLHYWMGQMAADLVEPGAFPLFLDLDGSLTESRGANIFLVRDGSLLTPEGRNILRGVSRRVVMELAEELDIPCCECNLEEYDLYMADEAFFTSTPYCLIPATKFNGVPIGNGKPGPVTQRLLAAWSQAVGVDIVGQVRKWAKLT